MDPATQQGTEEDPFETARQLYLHDNKDGNEYSLLHLSRTFSRAPGARTARRSIGTRAQEGRSMKSQV